jgi:hypothetical protein
LRPGREYRKVKLQKSDLSSSPGQGASCSSETNYDRRTGAKSKVVFFEEEITRTEVTNQKIALGTSLGEYLGLGIIIIFYGIQRYVSNDQVCAKLSGNKC